MPYLFFTWSLQQGKKKRKKERKAIIPLNYIPPGTLALKTHSYPDSSQQINLAEAPQGTVPYNSVPEENLEL